MSLHMSKCHIVGIHMSRLIYDPLCIVKASICWIMISISSTFEFNTQVIMKLYKSSTCRIGDAFPSER